MLFLIVLPTWGSPLQLSPFIIHPTKLPTHHAFPSWDTHPSLHPVGHMPSYQHFRPSNTSVFSRAISKHTVGNHHAWWRAWCVCWMNERTDKPLLQSQSEEGSEIHIFTQNPISEHKHVYHSYPLLTSLYFSPLDQVHFSLFTDYLFLFSLPETQEFLLNPWLHCQAQGSGWHTISGQ